MYVERETCKICSMVFWLADVIVWSNHPIVKQDHAVKQCPIKIII